MPKNGIFLVNISCTMLGAGYTEHIYRGLWQQHKGKALYGVNHSGEGEIFIPVSRCYRGARY